MSVKERPILFSAPMVRAILEGRKTQTRRIVKTKQIQPFGVSFTAATGPCPYGKIGERLWCRETIWQWGRWDEVLNDDDGDKYRFVADGQHCVHVADNPITPVKIPDIDSYRKGASWIKRPSIFMPRWASRITLQVTDIHVERLQDISNEDAVAEGMDGRYAHGIGTNFQCGSKYELAEKQFQRLWNDINGAGSWEENPWVWVVEFSRIEVNP